MPADGPISVLELLELQARARAIRSQLAMEPITKIEVKSDDEDEEQREKPSKDKTSKEKHRNPNKRKSSELTTSKEASRAQSQTQPNGKSATATPAPQKKIKLKRNYRNTTKSPEKQLESQPAAVTKQPEVIEETRKSRSASPDVIPIPAEPETLLISDSTDEDETPKQKQETKATEAEAQPAALPAAEPEPAELSEPEEGEVRDEIVAEAEPVAETETATKSSEEQKPEESSMETEEPLITAGEEATVEKSEGEATAEEEPACSKETMQPDVPTDQPHSINSVDDDDHNDDVISIGGDLEMIEELAKVEDEPVVKVKSEAPEILRLPDEEDNDVISLNTSEDEHEKLEEPSSEVRDTCIIHLTL